VKGQIKERKKNTNEGGGPMMGSPIVHKMDVLLKHKHKSD